MICAAVGVEGFSWHLHFQTSLFLLSTFIYALFTTIATTVFVTSLGFFISFLRGLINEAIAAINTLYSFCGSYS